VYGGGFIMGDGVDHGVGHAGDAVVDADRWA